MLQNEMLSARGIKISDVFINDISYSEMLSLFEHAVDCGEKITGAYINFNSINFSLADGKFKSVLEKFNLRHPDGIGVYIASKILYGSRGLRNKITGSDFYPYLTKKILERNWKIYILGETEDTLKRIKVMSAELNIVGMSSGYGFNSKNVLNEIKLAAPEVLLIGLGTPLQEEWIIKNIGDIQANIVLAVGEGLKVLAGNKVRGPLLVRQIGLEWAVRLLSNPSKFAARYILGIPQFLFRVIKEKYSS